jgi:hypothetical protein
MHQALISDLSQVASEHVNICPSYLSSLAGQSNVSVVDLEILLIKYPVLFYAEESNQHSGCSKQDIDCSMCQITPLSSVMRPPCSS